MDKNYLKMKKIKITRKSPLLLALTAVLMIIGSCAPQTKEAYLEEYKEFISEVSEDYESFTNEDWERSLAEFRHFSDEWYLRFKDELTWKEQLEVGMYQVQYNLLRVKESSANFFDTYVDDDFKGLKEQIEFYYENEMEEDIEFLVDQAREIGDSAVSVMKEIFEELEIEMEALFD